MKLILTSLLLLAVTFASAQKNGATMHDLAGLPGNWTGKSTHNSSFGINVVQTTAQIKLEILNNVDSMDFNFTHVEANGKTSTHKTSLHIYNDGKHLVYDSEEFDITAIRRLGRCITIAAEPVGADRMTGYPTRVTFIVRPGILNITTVTKYPSADNISVRNRLELKKG